MQSEESSRKGALGRAWYHVVTFLRDEPVFCVSLVAALISMCFVPPSTDYVRYVNGDLLATLLCFMLCVAGLRKAGALEGLAGLFLRGRRSTTFLCGVLVALPFFTGMFITNDVALIAFVPFACLVLGRGVGSRMAAVVVVLQAIAANMGSMLTPFGNPQNLYVFEVFDLTAGEFLLTTTPYVLFSGVLLAGACLLAGRRVGSSEVETPTDLPQAKVSGVDVAIFSAAFVVCVLCVLDVIGVLAMLVGVCSAVLIRDWRLFGKVDWYLLATFLYFFVFSGNLAAIPAVHTALTSAMSAQPFWITLGTSQVISNVPATALLAVFTDNWQALLLGADIGGLGTPVASLASLIAFGFYRKMRPEGSPTPGRFLVLFLVLNVVFLALNCGLKLLLA